MRMWCFEMCEIKKHPLEMLRLHRKRLPPGLVVIYIIFYFSRFRIYRQLAQISRSTRGVVLLLCDLTAARRIMSEAQRLNMVGGHFIWIWADTSSTTEFFDVYQHQQGYDIAETHERKKNNSIYFTLIDNRSSSQTWHFSTEKYHKIFHCIQHWRIRFEIERN